MCSMSAPASTHSCSFCIAPWGRMASSFWRSRIGRLPEISSAGSATMAFGIRARRSMSRLVARSPKCPFITAGASTRPTTPGDEVRGVSLQTLQRRDHEAQITTIVDLDVDRWLEGDLRSPSRGYDNGVMGNDTALLPRRQSDRVLCQDQQGG